MKKWTVLVIAALLVVILGLQYLLKRNEAKLAVQNELQRPGESVGVGLPSGATAYAQDYSQSTPDTGAVAASGRFTLGEAASIGACNGGSIKDILAAHGKIWGYSAKGKVFKRPETENVYEALEKFFSCGAIAADDIAACQFLPDDMPKEAKGSAYFLKPGKKCAMYTNTMLLFAYAAGKYGDIPACMRLLAGLHGGLLQDAQPDDFCSNVVKGLGKFCEHLPFANEHKMECQRMFPGTASDCGGRKDCLDSYALYMALKTGNSGQCPAAYRVPCEAFISKSQTSCSSLAMEASKLYCSYLAKLKK